MKKKTKANKAIRDEFFSRIKPDLTKTRCAHCDVLFDTFLVVTMPMRWVSSKYQNDDCMGVCLPCFMTTVAPKAVELHLQGAMKTTYKRGSAYVFKNFGYFKKKRRNQAKQSELNKS